MADILNECREKMEKCVSSLEEGLNTLRTGRANASLLNNLSVKTTNENINITNTFFSVIFAGGYRTRLDKYVLNV